MAETPAPVKAGAVTAGMRAKTAAIRAAQAALHQQATAIAQIDGSTQATAPGDPIHIQTGSLADAARSQDVTAFARHALGKPAMPDALKAQILAALDAPASTGPDAAPAHGAYAAGSAAGAGAPVTPHGSDSTTVETHGNPAILDSNPLGRLAGMAAGVSAGGGLMSPPDQARVSHATALAVAKAFQAPPGTAEQAASDAADTATTGDAALDQRIALARTVYKVDGTDQLIRRFTETTLMQAVITETAKYIEINKLSETDKYRLSAIVGTAQTELEEKILNLGARTEAQWLSADDLKLLIAAYDNDAQRKMTQLRLSDTGASDRRAMNDLQLARDLIIRDYDAR